VTARGAVAAIALCTALLCAARYAPIIDDPWDNSIASANGGGFIARFDRAWSRVGFKELKGQPYLYFAPTDPPTGRDYRHHPPGCFWLMHAAVELVGRSESGFRALPIVATSILGGLLAAFAARLAGRAAGVCAGLAAIVCPMSAHFGWMPNPEGPTTTLIVAAVLLHARFRKDGGYRAFLAPLAVFLATQLDWQGTFAAASIGFLEATAPRGDRRFGRVIAAGVAATLSVAAVLCIVRLWTGDFASAFADVFGTARTTSTRAIDSPLGPWCLKQADYLAQWYAPPLLLSFAFSLYRVVRRGKDAAAIDRFAIALVLPGVLNVLAFRSHAERHDYWTYYALPGFVLSAGSAGAALAKRLPKVLVVLVVAAATVWMAATSIRRFEHYRTTSWRDLGALVGQVAGRNDFILSTLDFAQAAYYIDAWTYEPIRNVADIDLGIELKRDGRLKADRVVVLIDERGGEPAFIEACVERLRREGPVTMFGGGPIEGFGNAPRVWIGVVE
jgi:hypothetical protein